MINHLVRLSLDLPLSCHSIVILCVTRARVCVCVCEFSFVRWCTSESLLDFDLANIIVTLVDLSDV